MSRRSLAFLYVACLTVFAIGGDAQTSGNAQSSAAPPAPGTNGRPQAVDPLLVKPVAQLTPEQMEMLQKRLSDWAGLNVFREENERMPPPEKGRVVFLGDSITIAWQTRDNNLFFPGKGYIDRGISGQTTPQMLVRFQQDVVALKPAVVVILGGINDLAGNTGFSTPEMTEDNFRSMVAVAQANGIHVVLSNILPSTTMPWRGGLNASQQIRTLNAWLQQFAEAHDCTWLDYYSAMTDAEGGMKPGLSKDGVHPTPAGYAVMTPLAQAAIDRALHTATSVVPANR